MINKINKININMHFIEHIYKNGGIVYLIGGIVRDKLFREIHNYNKQAKDYDILVTGISIEKLKNILKIYGNVKEVGKAFGVLVFKHKDYPDSFDIAIPRKEISTGPGYKDFKIVLDENISIEEDLKRRDATINSIALQIHTLTDLNEKYNHNCYIDEHNGINDIKNKIWRAIGDPYKRFTEDPTRILRAIRQCAELDLSLDQNTEDIIVKHSDLLKNIIQKSPVRLTNEFIRTLKSNNCIKWISFIFEHNISKYIELELKLKYNISSSLKYAIEHKYNYVIRLSILLNGCKIDNIDKWTKDFELSATKSFDKKYTKLIIHFKKYITAIDNILLQNNNVAMRELIQNVHNNEYMDLLIKIYESIKCKKSENLRLLYNNNKNIPLDESQIALNGNTIIERFKDFKVRGETIGIIKLWLFNEIIKGNVNNIKNDLICHLKLNLVNIIK